MELLIKSLTVAYEAKEIITDLSLKVESSSFHAILGDSGSGKTTILKAIAGLTPIREGSITLNDMPINDKPVKDRNIAYVFQKPLLFPHMSVYDNIAFKLSVLNEKQENIVRQVSELASKMSIAHLLERMPRELSGGEQQRVSIARALIGNPSIVLMDEPFSNLDPTLRQEMGLWLKELQYTMGLTILFVTHDVTEAMTLADRIAFLLDGSIVQNDLPGKLYKEPENQIVASFFGPCNFIPCETDEKSYVVRPHEIRVDLAGDSYQVVRVNEVGKSHLYTLLKGNTEINVESFESLKLSVGQYCDIQFEKQDRKCLLPD